MHQRRKLILNADDFGYSKNFNRGIVELIDLGVVTSTTVMINKKYPDPEKLKKNKNISIGLHLVLPLAAEEKDIEEQILKFKKIFGQLPSHLDGHKYFHLLAGNLPKVLKIAKKYQLPVRSVSAPDRNYMKKSKIKTPDRFISWHPSRKEKLLHELKNVKEKKVELLCHPGYIDPKSKSSYNKQREMELKFLKSEKFKKIIANFDLISYGQL